MKISKEYDGKIRTLYEVKCTYCKSVIYKPAHLIKRSTNQFCDRGCFNKHQVAQKIWCICARCGISFKRTKSKLDNSKSGLYFCGRKCKDLSQKIGGIEEIMPDHYGVLVGLSDYRERALQHYGSKCKQCGYDKEVKMLDVDHIDSNRANNIIDNLQVLCVWCHTLKTRKVTIHNR